MTFDKFLRFVWVEELALFFIRTAVIISAARCCFVGCEPKHIQAMTDGCNPPYVCINQVVNPCTACSDKSRSVYHLSLAQD